MASVTDPRPPARPPHAATPGPAATGSPGSPGLAREPGFSEARSLQGAQGAQNGHAYVVAQPVHDSGHVPGHSSDHAPDHIIDRISEPRSAFVPVRTAGPADSGFESAAESPLRSALHEPDSGVGHEPGPEPRSEARPQGRPRSAAVDAAILAATRELLAEQGWDRLSLGDVAARAGVAKTTLYRRWAGKAELVVDAMAEIFDTLQPVDAGSVRADAAAVITDLVALLTRPETQAAFLALAAESARDPRLRAVVREKIIDRQRHLVLSGAARARARAGTAQIHDPALVFDVITGTIVHRLLIAGEPVDEDYLNRFLDFLLAALDPLR